MARTGRRFLIRVRVLYSYGTLALLLYYRILVMHLTNILDWCSELTVL